MDFGRAVTADTTVYAKWTMNEGTRFTVSFDTQGHGSVPAQTVYEGGTASRPADPTAPGWAFGGWYTDRACTAGNKYDFGSAVVGNLTLYAKWAVASQGFAPEGDRDAMGLAIAAVVPALAAMAGAVFFRSARMPRNYP